MFIVLFILLQVTCKGQDFSRDYNKLGKEESDLRSYGPDKSAEAVVLFDLGKSYFEQTTDDFKVIFEKATRIKILSDAGLKWAQIEIPYYNEDQIYEQIYDLEACTFNPESGVFNQTYFNPADAHDEKINEQWTIKKFALPNVKAGSIIQYRYKIRSDYKFNFRDWEFQSRIPTVYSEYEASMIPFYEYAFVLQGASKFDSKSTHKTTGLSRRFGLTEFQDLVYSFAMKNVPAFNDEEFITSINDYLIKLDFQLCKINYPSGVKMDVISTWPDLVKNLIKDPDVLKFANKSEKLLGKLISADSLLNKSQKEKFNYILDYVKSNYNWNGYNAKYASKSPGELLNDKHGNAADLNLFTIGLLNAAGIEASPVILSTRGNGQIKVDYPMPKFFNYLLIFAKVDGINILSDATEIHCPNDRIPSKCLSDKGLLIKPGEVQWVGLQNNIPSEIQTSITIDSIGKTSTAKRSIMASEYDGLKYRNNYGNDKKKILTRVNDNIFSVDESSIVVVNHEKKEMPYIMSFRSTYKTESVNNKIYLSPFLDEAITENPLKQYSRTYPIDLTYPLKRSYKSVIKIPEGYKVEFVPEKENLSNQLFELNYNVVYDDKTIDVTFNYTFKKSNYSPADYSNLKFFFSDIVKKGNDKLVLIHI